MASIFKKSIIKEKVEKIEIKDFDEKIEILQAWFSAYEDGTLKKINETQAEQAFNNDIFKKILGYREFPSNPYTLIPKVSAETGGQKADAALGYFTKNEKKVYAVVEIKDVNTPLERSQRREGNLTPIQQAFKYKPLFKECKFVIATNFYEIRLFQDNQLDYEVFTLESLINPDNDYFEFKKFVLLLSAKNFISERGKSNTEGLLSEIRIEQEKITKKFYKKYSDIRISLMRDIWKQNKEKRDIHFVADKAQKLIDRIVFASFCEDTGLLPDNTLHKVFKHAELGYSSVWKTLQGFFDAIDKGSDKLGIPTGYNGGLFKEDEEMSSLVISDEVLRGLETISRYDFENELSVNVLGHVFEQSITDLEEIKKKVSPEEADHKSKRKKDGIFYTPEYIVDYIVQNSLGRYLRENEERIFEKHKLNLARKEQTYREREIKALKEYKVFLENIKVLDPACGSGAFLVKVFDYLLEENRRVGNLIGGLFNVDQMYKDILTNNIYGVDLNEESVRITQLSLWLKTAQKNKKLTHLDKNIQVGNSLIDDESIAGEKAFNWSERFSEIMDRGGFDVVVGNPPWIFARGGNFEQEIKDYYYKKYELANYQLNTYLVFFELSYSVIKHKGELGFIVPNTCLTIDSFKPFREFLLTQTNGTSITNIYDKVFLDASVDSCVITFKKGSSNTISLKEMRDEKVLDIGNFPSDDFKKDQMIINISMMKNKGIAQLLDKIEKASKPLSEFADVKSGLVAYEVGKGDPSQTEEMKNKRIYHSNFKASPRSIKYLDGKDVIRYQLSWSGQWLEYGKNLAAPRKDSLFKGPRILVRQIPSKPPYCIHACYVEKNILNDRNSNNIVNIELDPFFILGVINSSVVSFWFINKFDKFQRGTFPQFKVKELELFPIPTNLEYSKKIALEVRNIINNISSLAAFENKVDLLLSDLIKSKLKFLQIIDKQKEEILKLTQVKKLNISEKSEFIAFLDDTFLKYKKIVDEIDESNKLIDHFVYESFGLIKEDIDLIERSLFKGN